jgi:Gpi18-like mannosyltransferase
MTLVTPEAQPALRRRAGAVSRWGCLRTALLAYALTSTAVLLGVMLARDYVKTSPHMKHHPVDQDPLLRGFVRWDGYFYREIVTAGYSYAPSRASSAAFFPLYPLLARALVRLTGAPAEVALLVVSHACLVGAFVVLAAYVRRRWPNGPPELGPAVLVAFGLWPWGYFFRMAYSESLFALLCLVVLYGIHRRWGVLPLGFVVGLATAARPVGVGLLLPLAVHLWHHSATARGFLGRLAVAAPPRLLGAGGLHALPLPPVR